MQVLIANITPEEASNVGGTGGIGSTKGSKESYDRQVGAQRDDDQFGCLDKRGLGGLSDHSSPLNDPHEAGTQEDNQQRQTYDG